jgi:hypothetical protein
MTGFLVSLLVVAATGVAITGMTLLARYLRRHGRGGPVRRGASARQSSDSGARGRRALTTRYR